VARPIDCDGDGVATADMGAWEEYDPAAAVGDEVGSAHSMYLRNHPNPFNPGTTIAFELPRDMRVSLRVYDVSGRLVDVLIDDQIVRQGSNAVDWRGRDLTGRLVPAGVYYYRLEAGDLVETKSMMLLN